MSSLDDRTLTIPLSMVLRKLGTKLSTALGRPPGRLALPQCLEAQSTSAARRSGEWAVDFQVGRLLASSTIIPVRPRTSEPYGREYGQVYGQYLTGDSVEGDR